MPRPLGDCRVNFGHEVNGFPHGVAVFLALSKAGGAINRFSRDPQLCDDARTIRL